MGTGRGSAGLSLRHRWWLAALGLFGAAWLRSATRGLHNLASEQPEPALVTPLEPTAEKLVSSSLANAAPPPPPVLLANATRISAPQPLNLCESTEFAGPGARYPVDVSIFVFAWRRLASLKRLVTSLQSAEYCGGRAEGRLSLTFLVDVGASPAVLTYLQSVQWAQGEKRVVVEPASACTKWESNGKCAGGRGIRGMWIDVMGRELERNEPAGSHPLPLEDDIEVSPLYYWWLRRASDAYGPFDALEGIGSTWKRDALPGSHQLVGVSLYTPRLDEISYPSRHWRPRWPSMARQSPGFLMGLPCSWGALYFRASWRRFLAFYKTRAFPPFYNFSAEAFQKGKLRAREVLGDPHLAIPNSRASTWPRSWKRFMIDYMYGRGDVMLYPSGPEDLTVSYSSYSFSTTYMERGAHSGTDGVVESDLVDGLRPASEYDRRKTVPLNEMARAAQVLEAFETMPPINRLPVIDLHHRRSPGGLKVLSARGDTFVRLQVALTAASTAKKVKLTKVWLMPYGEVSSSSPHHEVAMQKSPSVSASPRKTPVVESPPRVYASSAASTPNTRASDVGASSPYPRLNGEASARQSDKGGADSEVALLRQEVARMQLLLQASESKVAMWEECMQQLVHCVMLSPDMNDIYKLECSTLLRDALKTVEQIQAVRFVDCSFPSVPSEAPHIQLIRWESMQDSEWHLRWAPSWSVQVAVEGSQYLQFSLTLRLFDLRVSGRITLKMSTDLSTIIISFKQPPKLRLKTECTVSWGAVPLPLQTYIETVVQDEFQRWTMDNVVAPHEMTLHPTSFQPKQGLTDADVERAIKAVGLARAISNPVYKAS